MAVAKRGKKTGQTQPASFGESGWAAELKRSRVKREPPTAGRGRETFDRILAAAAEMLDEVGFERMSTNEICARADITPPALYHYFYDKYDILEELALRLLKRQNEAFDAWVSRGGLQGDYAAQVGSLAEWFRINADVTGAMPGSLSILRALRALPGLAHIRLASQRMLSDQLCDIYARANPEMDRRIIWCRVRISCEFGYMVDEMALEENRVANDVLFREVATMLIEAPIADAT